jgi:ankyrin repeat protein
MQNDAKVIQAIENDSLFMLESILKAGYDVNKPIIIGEEYDLEEYDEVSLLSYAICQYASRELVELLLSYGIDIYEVNNDGISSLDVAIKYKRVEIVELCIEKGFDLNKTKRKSGLTPLILASCFNDVEIATILLKNGADINGTDGSGLTAKDYAKKMGQKKMIEFLDKNGGKYNLYS